jgi:RNA polymerase sigma-70 factor, ECF subfamily
LTGDRLRQAADALNEAIANRLERRRPTSLEHVLRAARSGDDVAFVKLWRCLQPELLWFFTILAPDAAEELATETWLQVVRGVGQFEGDESAFRAWLFTIAHTKVVDWWQCSSTKADIQSSDLSLAEDSATARDVSSRSVMALVAALPADQGEAIVLRVVAGLEVDQVEAIMGKRPGTVRALTHHGLRQLARALGPEDPRASTSPPASRSCRADQLTRPTSAGSSPQQPPHRPC